MIFLYCQILLLIRKRKWHPPYFTRLFLLKSFSFGGYGDIRNLTLIYTVYPEVCGIYILYIDSNWAYWIMSLYTWQCGWGVWILSLSSTPNSLFSPLPPSNPPSRSQTPFPFSLNPNYIGKKEGNKETEKRKCGGGKIWICIIIWGRGRGGEGGMSGLLKPRILAEYSIHPLR